MSDPKPPTDNSESSGATPTQLQLDAERAELQDRRRVIRGLQVREEPRAPIEGSRDDAREARRLLGETTRALARIEVVLDMTIDVLRAHTEQLVIANKIAARKLALERKEVDQEADESRRVDRVLDAGLSLVSKVATDSRLWTAILTTLGWFVLQVVTGAQVSQPPMPAP